MDEFEMMEIPTNEQILPVDYKGAFFQDLRDIEGLVQNSLFLYVAYDIKGKEAALYTENPKADVPTLKKEAKLRGVSLEEMVIMVKDKGAAFTTAIAEMELLRVEFNLRYASTKTNLDRLQLRDEFLPRARKVMESV